VSTVLDQRNPPKISTEPLPEITDLIESGILIPAPGRVFPLREAAQAQAFSEPGMGVAGSSYILPIEERIT